MRTEARIKTTIWSPDNEFAELPADAKYLYLVLLTQDRLNFCGVMSVATKAWIKDSGMSAARVKKAIQELSAYRYIVIDPETEELWIRSFLKHDGILDKPYVIIAMSKEFSTLRSKKIGDLIIEAIGGSFINELSTRFPKVFKSDDASELAGVFRERYAERFGTQSVIPSHAGARDPCFLVSLSPCIPVANDPAERRGANPAERRKEFDRFWAIYPRHEAKPKAQTAFTKAVAKASLEDILAGAQRFRDDPNRVDEFTPHPASWLNQGRWEDDPLPKRSGGRAGTATARVTEFGSDYHSIPDTVAVGATGKTDIDWSQYGEPILAPGERA